MLLDETVMVARPAGLNDKWIRSRQWLGRRGLWRRKVFRAIFTLAILLVIVGCANVPPIESFKKPDASQAEQRAMLVGKWFGEAPTNDGGRRLQIIQRDADGTFKVSFRVIEPSGKVFEQTELGLWGISGSVYFTITRAWIEGERVLKADPTDASLDDAYDVLELTKERFRYRSVQSNNEFSLSRVADSFEFPEQ